MTEQEARSLKVGDEVWTDGEESIGVPSEKATVIAIGRKGIFFEFSDGDGVWLNFTDCNWLSL
jgi:hypothetical protein